MLTGLQIHINAINAIIPGSFIFVLDSTDRTFLYKSSDCKEAMDIIVEVDQHKGLESLFSHSRFYSNDCENYFYMIKKISSHTFSGFFALKNKFAIPRIEDAKAYFAAI